MRRVAEDLNRRGALVLGISGPDPGLGEVELGAPARLAEAAIRAGGLAVSLAAYGYRDVLHRASKLNDRVATAADVEVLLNSVLAEPGLVVVHLLTHGQPGPNQGVLYVLGPDGAKIPTSVGEWLNRAEIRDGDRGPVLFVLDVCFAGVALRHQLQHLVDAKQQQAWVLAAANESNPAYDGRLTRALAQVLDRFRSGELQMDPSVRYIPLRRVFAEVDHLVREQSEGSYPQEICSTYVPLHLDINQLEFFPNPRWDPVLQHSDFRAEVADETAALLDEAFDPQHFMRRAGTTEAVFGQVGKGFFHGRAIQLKKLRGWAMGFGPALRIVTGKPGVGKSALLGVVVCAAHPALREKTRDLWNRLADIPPRLPEGSLAVVHARRHTVVQIITSIAQQWQLPDEPDKGWTVQQVVAAVRRSLSSPGRIGAIRLLVVDAVDEAERPGDLVAEVLSPLAAALRDDGEPLCRMLIASRDEPYLRPLIDSAVASGGLDDLGMIPRQELRPILAAYVKDLMGHGTPYETLQFAPAADVMAETIASALTTGPGADTDPAPQKWGEFLVAGLYVRHVLDLPPVEMLAQARELGEAIPHDLRGVLELDLARPVRGQNEQVLHATARALAFAEGSGMPERVTCHSAAAFLASHMDPLGPSSAQTRQALDRLSFYLRRAVDVDGSTLYRLFHQGLADQLKADGGEHSTAQDRPSPTIRVWSHIHAMVPFGPGDSREWKFSEPYLLRHAGQHAAEADQLEDLLQDTSYLINADPVGLAPLIADLRAGGATQARSIYRASLGSHSPQRPAARAQILSFDAARYGNRDLAKRLSSGSIWQPIWATKHVYTGSVTAVAIGRFGFCDVIVCGGRNAEVNVWNAETGERVAWLTGHVGSVPAVAIGRVSGNDVVISAGHDGTVRKWRRITTNPTVRSLNSGTGWPRPVYAVAAGRTGGRDVIVCGGRDGKVRVWAAADGQLAGQPMDGQMGWITAIAIGRAEDHDVIVCGGRSNRMRIWNANTLQPIGWLTGHIGEVCAVALGRAGDRDVIISGGTDGTVRTWGAISREPIGPPMTDHTGPVRAVAIGRLENRQVIVSGGDDGTLRTWDAGTGQALARQQFPGKVLSLALSNGRLAAAAADDVVVLKVNRSILQSVATLPGQRSMP
jgi:WD domain, G-beta repeat